MKAYLATDRNNKYHPVIVFAENPEGAKDIAYSTQELWKVPYISLRVRRKRELDCYYTEGKKYLNFNTPNDRLVLVKELGWWCNSNLVGDIYEYDMYECRDCAAREFCNRCKKEYEKYAKIIGE